MRRSFATAWAGLVLLCAWPAYGDLRVESARLGHAAYGAQDGAARLYGGVEGLDTWLPFEIVLSNTGQETYAGELALVEGSLTRRERIRYTRRVTLGPGARQRLSFPVLYDPRGYYGLEFRDESLGHVRLITANTGAPVVMPTIRQTSEKLVLVVRPKDQRAQGISHLEPPLQQHGFFKAQREWLVADLPASRLPNRGVLYHRVDLVVLDDIDLGRLSPDQQAALLEYVALGGVLWISQLKRKPAAAALLQPALPGRAAGTRELSRVRALDAYLGQPFALHSPRTFAVFDPLPDAVAWDAEAPVVVHHRYERGWVMLAGYEFCDPRVFDKPRGLIRELIQLRSRNVIPLVSAYETNLRKKLPEGLRGMTKKSVPPQTAVLGLIGGYLLVGIGVPFLLTRRSGRLELAWIAVAAMSLVGTGAVFGLGRAYEMETRASRVSVIEGGAESGAHLRTSYWSVFSQRGGPLQVGLGETASAFPFEDAGPLTVSADGATLQTHPQDATLLVTTDRAELTGSLSFQLIEQGRARVEVRDGLKLVQAWGWSAQGQPLQLELPPLVERPTPDPFEGCLTVFKNRAQMVAEQGSRPVLLYRYAADETLSDLPEASLNLGLARASGWAGSQGDTVPCRLRELATPNRGWAEFEFTLRVPEGMQAEAVHVEWRRRYRSWTRRERLGSSIYDWSRGSWVQTDKRTYRASGNAYWVTPLGTVRGRVRLGEQGNWTPNVHLRIGPSQ